MQEKYYYTIKETVYSEKLDNGLEVYLLPKYGFTKTYGIFATKFGSIDTSFIPLGEKEMVRVEDGIAHFLEHKMFELEDGDVSDVFSNLGASSNAYTSSSRTAYLFSTADKVNECVTTLLDFVQEIYLTEENVEKEKGIIGQEILMYEDDPDWKSYFGSIDVLYQNHPVGTDIAGSVESVNRTTREMLEKCYHTFYHPSNMVIFVVGNFDAAAMMNLIKDNQQSKKFNDKSDIKLLQIDEPNEIKDKHTELEMDVTMPKVMVSTKINEKLTDSNARLIRELTIGMLLDFYFSKSSDIFSTWVSEELINDTFGAGYTQERDYGFIQIGGDSYKYAELTTKIKNLYEIISSSDISDEDFERIKRKNLGAVMNVFNSPEHIASLFIKHHFEDVDAFELIDIIYDISKADLLNARKYFDLNYTASYIVKPFENNYSK